MSEIAATSITLTCLVLMCGVWVGAIGFALSDMRRRHGEWKEREKRWMRLLK